MRGCVTMDRSWVVNFVNEQYQYLKSRRAKQAPYSFIRTSEQGSKEGTGREMMITLLHPLLTLTPSPSFFLSFLHLFFR